MALVHVFLDAEQSVQAAPFVPQAFVCVPVAQMSPTQQPVQFCELQSGGLHVCDWHVSFDFVQSAHATAPVPHMWMSVPARHSLPRQHPFTQWPPPQTECRHWWLLHVSLLTSHSAHGWPPIPHA